MSIRNRNWFFTITRTALRLGTRFKTDDQPTESTFKDLLDTTVLKSEPNDRAKEDVGTFSSSTTGHVTLATDAQAKNREVKKIDRSLVVQPSQLTEVSGSTNITLYSDMDVYNDELVTVTEEPLITSRPYYKLTVPADFTTFLNSVFAKITANTSKNVSQDNTLANHNARILSNKQAIESLAPGGSLPTTVFPGAIVESPVQSAPSGWVKLQGDVELDKATYANLYAAIGDQGGTPSDANNFVIWKAEFDQTFIRGAGVAGTYETGGSDDEYIQANQLPYHEHNAGTLVTNQAGGHTHSTNMAPNSGTGSSGSVARAGTDNPFDQITPNGFSNSGAHTHTVEGRTAGIFGAGQQQSLSKLPSYLAMNRFMYTGVI